MTRGRTRARRADSGRLTKWALSPEIRVISDGCSAWVMVFCDVNFHLCRVVLCSTGERAWLLMFPEDQRDDEFEKTLHHARGHVLAGRQLYR